MGRLNKMEVKKMKKGKIKKLKLKIKKDFKSFMKDESGSISKENILKIGIGTIAAVSMFSGLSQAAAPTCDGLTAHTSDNTVQWVDVGGGEKQLIPSHTHHTAHCSY